MATETVAPPPIPTTDDEVNEEKKTVAEGGVPLTKESGEEILKTDGSVCLEIPPESEAVDHEKIGPPVNEAEIVDAPVSSIPVEDETKVNDPIPYIQEEVVEAEKNVTAAASDVPLVEESKVESDLIPDIPEQEVDAVKIPEVPKEPVSELMDEGQVEKPKIVDASQASYEATEEPLQVTTDHEKESVETVLTDNKESELESFEVQKPELATPEVEEKPGEPCEVIQEAETKPEEVELEKTVHDETVNDQGSAADMVEPCEAEPCERSRPILFSEEVKSEAETTPILEMEVKPREPCEVTREVETKLEEVELEKIVQYVKDESSAADKVEPIPFSEEGKTEAVNTPTLEVEEAPEQPKVEEEDSTHDDGGPGKSLDDDAIVKDEGSSANKVEASTILEKGQTDKVYEPSQVKSPEEVLLDRNGADYSLPDVSEAVAFEEDQKKGEVDVVEKLKEDPAVEIEKVDGEVLKTKETVKEIFVTEITEYTTEPIKEEEKAGVNGIEVVEEPAEEVKLGTVGEENVETLEIEETTQPIELDEKKELSGLDAVEKLAEEESVKLETVGEENVETLAIEEKEKNNVVTEESTQPIELDEKKELSGLDVAEKLTEIAAVEVENHGKKNAETEDGKSVITEDTSQPILEDKKKVLSGADVNEKLADETAVKLEEVGEENVDNIAASKESEKKESSEDVVEKLAEEARVEFEKVGEVDVLDEVLTQQDNADANRYIITPSEVTEKSFEGAGKDVEPMAETEKAEHIKDETPGTIETEKEDNVEEKQAEVTTLFTDPLGESKPFEPEVKGDEPATLEKTIEDVAKSDRDIELPAKDDDDTKPSEDLAKEVPAKTSHKQSNTILSKVKQTLVKAKKVITGKSPSSKTPASESKDDIKVK